MLSETLSEPALPQLDTLEADRFPPGTVLALPAP